MMLFPAFLCLAAPWNMKWFVVLVGRQRETSSFVQDEISFSAETFVYWKLPPQSSLPVVDVVDDLNTREERTRDKTIKIKSILFFTKRSESVFVCLSDCVDNDISKNIQSRLRCWESSVLYFLLLLRVLLFYLTFFLVVLEFDTQKWRNKAMAMVSGTKFGSIIGEWLNGLGEGEASRVGIHWSAAKTALWLRKNFWRRRKFEF